MSSDNKSKSSVQFKSSASSKEISLDERLRAMSLSEREKFIFDKENLIEKLEKEFVDISIQRLHTLLMSLKLLEESIEKEEREIVWFQKLLDEPVSENFSSLSMHKTRILNEIYDLSKSLEKIEKYQRLKERLEKLPDETLRKLKAKFYGDWEKLETKFNGDFEKMYFEYFGSSL